ncbi:hypothetical protein [Algoriphagus faecimaris]|nr:hypothetical protein [Algoriphagus faecimaris]
MFFYFLLFSFIFFYFLLFSFIFFYFLLFSLGKLKQINIKNFKIILSMAAFLVAMSFQLNAQTACDTTPDVGQTVGRCFTMSGPGGDVAACNELNDGPICYFTEPKEEELPEGGN